jgi:hypothetical protein
VSVAPNAAAAAVKLGVQLAAPTRLGRQNQEKGASAASKIPAEQVWEAIAMLAA